MKTNEIIAGLRECRSGIPGHCKNCPVYAQDSGCLDRLHNVTADTLEVRQELIEELERQLSSAVYDLHIASECWSCGRNNKCHPYFPVAGPDAKCGNYKWRGASDGNVGGMDEHRWIPVTERLPEPFVSVLACIPSEAPLPAVHESYIADHEKLVCILTAERYGDGEVTHWMPLPEPPKEGA